MGIGVMGLCIHGHWIDGTMYAWDYVCMGTMYSWELE